MKDNQKQIDAIDIRILELLESNARISAKDIGREINMSSQAVANRIRHLEDTGVLMGFIPVINYSNLGYSIRAYINLEVSPAQKPEFYPYIESIPNVVECSCVTGDYSMLIEVIFQTAMHLDHFINELQHFGRTKTLIAFSTSVEHRNVRFSKIESLPQKN